MSPKENSNPDNKNMRFLHQTAFTRKPKIVQKNYNGDMFRIIGRARSPFHLTVFKSIYINMKSHNCVDRRSSFSSYGFTGNISNRQAALIGQPQQSCARISDWPISIYNWVYIFPSVAFSIYILTFYCLKSVRR